MVRYVDRTSGGISQPAGVRRNRRPRSRRFQWRRLPGLDQPYLTQLLDPQLFINAPHGLLASPGTAVVVDAKQIIGRGGVAAMRERGRRRHADRGDVAVGA